MLDLSLLVAAVALCIKIKTELQTNSSRRELRSQLEELVDLLERSKQEITLLDHVLPSLLTNARKLAAWKNLHHVFHNTWPNIVATDLDKVRTKTSLRDWPAATKIWDTRCGNDGLLHDIAYQLESAHGEFIQGDVEAGRSITDIRSRAERVKQALADSDESKVKANLEPFKEAVNSLYRMADLRIKVLSEAQLELLGQIGGFSV